MLNWELELGVGAFFLNKAFDSVEEIQIESNPSMK